MLWLSLVVGLCFENSAGSSEYPPNIPGVRYVDRNSVFAREGDINIGNFIDIHSYSQAAGRCNQKRTLFGCGSELMVEYVVDKINQRQDLLPNVSLGFVSVDGCFNDMKSLELSTYFIRDVPINQSASPLSSTGDGPRSHYNVVGIVGPLTSRIAAAVASLLGVFHLPSVGLYPTSDDLSDKSRFKYFLRLVAPDRYQCQTVLDFIRYFGWTYVSLVYSQGPYGDNGAAQIDRFLRDPSLNYDICLAASLIIPSGASSDDVGVIVDALMAQRNARVVILFLDAEFLSRFFNVLRAKGARGRFVFLGGDSLTGLDVERYRDMLEGLFYVDHPAFPMPDFIRFLNTRTPSNYRGNIWVRELFEDVFKCRFDDGNSSNKTGVEVCDQNLTLNTTICMPHLGIVNRIYDAFSLYAWVLHEYIAEECPDGFSDKTVLGSCIRGNVLLQRLQNSSVDGTIGRINFDQNGDLIENLVVKQYQRSGAVGVYTSKVVSVWNVSRSILLVDEDRIDWSIFTPLNPSNTSHQPLTSLCSLPCSNNEYIIRDVVSCCWTCGTCRDNEIVNLNRTGCHACPVFTWPDDDSGTACLPIDPVYLHLSHPISISMLGLAVAGALLGLTCTAVYLVKRNHKLVKATSIELSLIILVGTLIVAAAVVVFVAKPDASSIVCVARSVGFHCGINIIYAPLLVKNVRIYRIFAGGRKSTRPPPCVSPLSQIFIVNLLILVQARGYQYYLV